MYRIRFHGRGGQGMKTASRLLGTAFFLSGFEVQDAPRYGAERRGAPIFAYVRASRQPIYERGVINRPDLILVADETLLLISAAAVLQGAAAHTVLVISTPQRPSHWQERLNFPGLVLTIPPAGDREDHLERKFSAPALMGAAARLVGVITPEALVQAIQRELAHFQEEVVIRNRDIAFKAYDLMAAHAGCVAEAADQPAEAYEKPRWFNLTLEEARRAAPAITAPATSEKVPTGLWRTLRPVIDYQRCRRCAWICGTLCPDGVVRVNPEGYPEIDYDHCKGCLICLTSCPSHAIRAVPETVAAETAAAGDRS
ncbi:MAG: 2-oxoacid:acceptor oxidoreductase family protein [Desulfobaccales bacterium]